MQNFKPAETVVHTDMSGIRAELSTLLGKVEHNGTKIIIHRHGKRIAAIVCLDDFAVIWDAEDEKLYGPKNPITGRRKGARWVEKTGWEPAVKVDAEIGTPVNRTRNGFFSRFLK